MLIYNLTLTNGNWFCSIRIQETQLQFQQLLFLHFSSLWGYFRRILPKYFKSKKYKARTNSFCHQRCFKQNPLIHEIDNIGREANVHVLIFDLWSPCDLELVYPWDCNLDLLWHWTSVALTYCGLDLLWPWTSVALNLCDLELL